MYNQILSKPIVIVLASNQRYFLGLYCAIASSLAHINSERQVKIFILDGGLFEESKSQLVKLVRCDEDRIVISFIKIDESIFQGASLRPGKSHMLYSRLLIPQLISEEKAIYLDADILVFRDLSILYDLDLKCNNVIAAVPDCETLTIGDDSENISNRLNIQVNKQYYNSGILLLDLVALRNLKFFEITINFLTNFSGIYRFGDQSAINFILHSRIQPLPIDWNYPSWKFDDQDDNKLDRIIHFTSTIPWLHFGVSPAHILFEEYAEQLGIKLDFMTSAYRESRRKQQWRTILSPLRAIAYLTISFGYRLFCEHRKSTSYAEVGRYWLRYILKTPSRSYRYSQRIDEIRNMKFDHAVIANS